MYTYPAEPWARRTLNRPQTALGFRPEQFLTAIKPDCLDPYPAVKGFYDAFAALPATIARGDTIILTPSDSNGSKISL
jgi:hypothetical protein